MDRQAQAIAYSIPAGAAIGSLGKLFKGFAPKLGKLPGRIKSAAEAASRSMPQGVTRTRLPLGQKPTTPIGRPVQGGQQALKNILKEFSKAQKQPQGPPLPGLSPQQQLMINLRRLTESPPLAGEAYQRLRGVQGLHDIATGRWLPL
jgi:hypothetical protein